jgi:hypothetical protein
MNLTQSELKELVTYDELTGIFTRNGQTNGHFIGHVCGSVNGNGYRNMVLNQKHYRAHRLAWLYVNGELPDKDIDHINGDRDDNRIANLRIASRAQNLRNTKLSANNTSGYKGVHLNKSTGKFRAGYMVNGKVTIVGDFDTAKKASEEYHKSISKDHGEYYRDTRQKC